MADEAERMQMRPHDEADTCAGPPSQQHMPYETPRHPGTVAHSSRPAVTNPIRMPPAPLLPPLPLPPFSLSFLFFSHSSSFSSFSPLSLPLLPSSSSSLSTFTFLFFSSSLPSSPLFPRTSAPDCPADAALGDRSLKGLRCRCCNESSTDAKPFEARRSRPLYMIKCSAHTRIPVHTWTRH